MSCRVWAPNAQAVSLVGPFNEWDEEKSADGKNQRRRVGSVICRLSSHMYEIL